VRTTDVAARLFVLLAVLGCRPRGRESATKATSILSPSAPALPWLAEADRLYTSALADKAPMRPGLDIVRFTQGAVLTDGDLYYPQVSLKRLAQVLDCLGFAPTVAHGLRELATMRSLDWQNRFRAACVLRLLDGGTCDRDLLGESLGQDADAGFDDLDGACIEGLMGQWKCCD
jgi:hypothetical protein